MVDDISVEVSAVVEESIVVTRVESVVIEVDVLSLVGISVVEKVLVIVTKVESFSSSVVDFVVVDTGTLVEMNVVMGEVEVSTDGEPVSAVVAVEIVVLSSEALVDISVVVKLAGMRAEM